MFSSLSSSSSDQKEQRALFRLVPGCIFSYPRPGASSYPHKWRAEGVSARVWRWMLLQGFVCMMQQAQTNLQNLLVLRSLPILTLSFVGRRGNLCISHLSAASHGEEFCVRGRPKILRGRSARKTRVASIGISICGMFDHGSTYRSIHTELEFHIRIRAQV